MDSKFKGPEAGTKYLCLAGKKEVHRREVNDELPGLGEVKNSSLMQGEVLADFN